MLEIRELSLYRDNKELVCNLDVQIAKGEVVSLMGESGIGKSTILNWLVGALPGSFHAEGEVWLDGKCINALSIEQRQISILFQEDLLFPHMSIGDNLAFALPASALNKAQRTEHITNTLASAELDGFYHRDPATLSGGQRARVSVLRALLARPKAILLDEPFSQLDKSLRQQFRQFVYEQISHMDIPALLVTHDEDDIPAGGAIIELEDFQPKDHQSGNPGNV